MCTRFWVVYLFEDWYNSIRTVAIATVFAVCQVRVNVLVVRVACARLLVMLVCVTAGMLLLLYMRQGSISGASLRTITIATGRRNPLDILLLELDFPSNLGHTLGIVILHNKHTNATIHEDVLHCT